MDFFLVLINVCPVWGRHYHVQEDRNPPKSYPERSKFFSKTESLIRLLDLFYKPGITRHLIQMPTIGPDSTPPGGPARYPCCSFEWWKLVWARGRLRFFRSAGRREIGRASCRERG